MSITAKTAGTYKDSSWFVKVGGVYAAVTAVYGKVGGVYVGTTTPLFLDLYPGAYVAFSMRKLRAGYNGPCIRLRRSLDNTEMDIGFSTTVDVYGDYTVDTATALAFAGGGDAFVVTKYDHGLGARHATQATAGNQAAFIKAGVVVGTTKPLIEHNGTSTRYPYDSSGYANISSIVIFTVVNSTTTAGQGFIHFISTGTNSAVSRMGCSQSAGGFNTGTRMLDGDGLAQTAKPDFNTGLHQTMALADYTAGTLTANFDGGTPGSLAIAAGAGSNTVPMYAGSGSANTSLFFSGGIGEEIVYVNTPTAIASAAAITTNQKTAFGVP